MNLTYQAERLVDVWDESAPLVGAHWLEVGHYPDIILDPDRELYLAHEAAGSLRCYTARDGARLVGYLVLTVRRHPHYRGSIQAVQDVLYLLPEYRRGGAGITLIRVAETHLRAEGVQVVYYHATLRNNLGLLLERLGCEILEEVYVKRLD